MSKERAPAAAIPGVMNALEIVVRGHARGRYPAERATISLAANMEGSDRDTVYRRALALHNPLGQDLTGLRDAGAVTRWSSDQLRVFSYRPAADGGRRPLMFRVALKVEAEFVDFEQLSSFLDRWAVEDGVEVGYTHWDVTEEHRIAYEADLRRGAVADASVKAQAFADAAGRGQVSAVQLADPGMLGDGHQDRPMGRAMFASAPMGSPSLELRPDDIELDISVDARFVAP
jgi:uncharacterized protein